MLKERDNLDAGVDGKIMDGWSQSNRMGRRDGITVTQECGQVRGSCELGNEISGFVKCGKYREWLRNCQLVKRGTVTGAICLLG